MKRAYHIIFFGFLFQASLSSSCALSQERQFVVWEPPILLSDTTNGLDSYSPEIELSGENIVHVTWEGDAFVWPYARSTDGGKTFSKRTILPDSSVHIQAVAPNIVADETSVISIARLSPPPPLPDKLGLVRSSDGGATWGPIEIVSDTASELWNPCFYGDTITFTYRPRPGYVDLLRSTNRGNTWSRTYQRFREDSRATFANGMVHMVVVTCSSGYCGLQYRRSRTLGDTWEDIKFIREPQTNFLPQDPNIIARSTPDGDFVFAMWRDRMYGGCGGLIGCTLVGRMGVVEADSTRWLPIRVMTSLPLGYMPEFASSRQGFAAIWPMDHESAPFAELRLSDDTTWSASFDPATQAAVAVIRPSVVLSSDVVHVVWEQKVITNSAHFWIMYRRGRLVSTEVDEHLVPSVSEPTLYQNYPNPFNNETSIRFVVGGTKTDHVSLTIFDVLGNEVARLVDRSVEPGVHSAQWETSSVGSGVYFCRLTTTIKRIVRKMMLIR